MESRSIRYTLDSAVAAVGGEGGVPGDGGHAMWAHGCEGRWYG